MHRAPELIKYNDNALGDILSTQIAWQLLNVYSASGDQFTVVVSCRERLSWIGRQRDVKVSLRWFPVHNDMAGNVKADGQAKHPSKPQW